MHADFAKRFWRRVAAPNANGCREWTGHRNWAGYGRVRWPGENQQQAHRVAYRLAIGPIPDGLHVCHRCDNPPCCEPSHLFAGTPSENALDCVSKGRHPRNVPAAKLTGAAVAVIRARFAAGESQPKLAAAFGVSKPTISRIVNRRIWRGEG